MDAEQLERAAELFKTLADPARLRILGLLAERPYAGHELATRLALTPPTISHHMRKLTESGLVAVTAQAQTRLYSLQMDALRAMPGAASPAQEAPSAEEDRVLRAFFQGTRLTQIPAARKKRVIVLKKLVERFDPQRTYPEAEVNELLQLAHEDFATLRRELVDYGYMTRDRGIYRVATALPDRGATVRQEIGNEAIWFAELVDRATREALKGEQQTPAAPPARTR